MDLIVFGDDWQVHPSTTQHLINHLPETDRIIWCNSIGMRTPEFSLRDGKRLLNKAVAMWRGKRSSKLATDNRLTALLQPRILPYHCSTLARKFNQRSLANNLEKLRQQYQFNNPAVLLSNPVVTAYLPDWLANKIYYLRLDDYALFGGVDQELALESEIYTLKHAKHVFYTARKLKPTSVESTYLPQAVNVDNFTVNKVPNGQKTLGYFGLIEESRFDFNLIYQVAQQNPEWTIEFMGDVTYWPEKIKQCHNIRMREKVDFTQLSEATKHWHCAWIPYRVCPLTDAINPLKVREYLALGLPVISSKMPEVVALGNEAYLYDTAGDVTAILKHEIDGDTKQSKLQRARSVKHHSWFNRANDLRTVLAS